MALEIKTMLDSVPGVRKDWAEDWVEDARADWRLDWDLVTGAPVNTAAPVASGTPNQGQVLSVTNGTFTGAGITYTYAWKRNGTPIALATAATYTVVAGDVGANITCTVTATNVDGAASATSNALGPVIALPVNTVAPVASGTPHVPEVLSVTTGTWTGGGITYTYQWLRGGVDIGGETAATYTLAGADLGANISCTVTATNAAGAVTQTSNALGPVLAMPVNTAVPTIGGTAQEGQLLTVTPGTWTGGGITLTYAWYTDTDAIAGGEAVIVGETGTTYTVVTGDVGKYISVVETATNAVGAVTATTVKTAQVVSL